MTSPLDADTLIRDLDLLPHPEGGFYRETWRTDCPIPASSLPNTFSGGDRAAATSIHFLLRAGDFSALHRIASDEFWFFHAGDPLEIVALENNEAPPTLHRLGLPPNAAPSTVIPAGQYFGARVVPGGRFALVSCVVAPGFDFRDFHMPPRTALLATMPRHADLIHAFTRAP